MAGNCAGYQPPMRSLTQSVSAPGLHRHVWATQCVYSPDPEHQCSCLGQGEYCIYNRGCGTLTLHGRVWATRCGEQASGAHLARPLCLPLWRSPSDITVTSIPGHLRGAPITSDSLRPAPLSSVGLPPLRQNLCYSVGIPGAPLDHRTLDCSC
jgi:hypothetical protein